MSKRRQEKTAVPPEFTQSKSPEYRVVFASGVFGGLNPNDGQMLFYLDRFEPEFVREQPGRQRLGKINRELQVEVHITPTEFKRLANWMVTQIQQYEANFGEIPIAPKQGRDDSPPGGLIT